MIVALVKRVIKWSMTSLSSPFVWNYKRSTQISNISVAHLFFHSLAIEPELSFRIDNDATHDFESWFVTVDEFKEILRRLYCRGYVLVDIHDAVSGKIELPEGKKPLILSFDDVNYWDYMSGYGFASRMLLTDDGHIANIYSSGQGMERITREGDSVPIIESFIETHPEFSHNGARGIIALTGKQGILGYRNPTNEKDTLLPLISELKRRGWLFASHSWGHSHSAYSDNPTFAFKGKHDVRKWMADVASIIGHTDIFITPFGVDTRNNPGLDAFIRKCGFKIFCTVSKRNQISITNGAYYMTRISIDGVRFSNNPHALHPYIGNPYTLLSLSRKRTYPDAELTAKGLVAFAESCIDSATLFAADNSIPREVCGLLKFYLMGGPERFHYVEVMDFDCASLCFSSINRSMDTMPEEMGICLYTEDCAGVYLGSGDVIEFSFNSMSGWTVNRAEITDRRWICWFHLPWVSYES